MLSRLLIITTCVILTLMGNKEAQAATIANPERCKAQAFHLYDTFTKSACEFKKSAEECLSDFNTNIVALNNELDRCESNDYVTLCRIVPGGFWPWDKGCTSLAAGKFTKSECEIKGKEDFVFHGESGSTTTFKGANSKCMNAIDYDCIKLCGK